MKQKLFKAIMAVLLVCTVSLPVAAQHKNITISAQNQPFKEFLQNVEKQSGYSFFYTDDVLSKVPSVTVNATESSVQTILHGILDGTGLTFETVGDKIAIKLDTAKKETGAAVTSKAPVTVSGVIVDENDQPIPGAAVMLKGTMSGGISDANGKYSIKCPQGSQLQFSCLGYKDVVVTVDGKSTAKIRMSSDQIALESVVVTALGIKRDEKSIGYSAAKVDGDKFANAATTDNWLNGLSGQVAGLNIDRTNSGPNSSMRVTIRGESTADLSNNTALFVVDGIPMYNTSTTSDAGGDGSSFAIDYGDGTSDIDPDNIESVTVLKGAAATALYGSSAANGAIIITTKSAAGQAAKLRVSYKFSFALDKVISSPDLQYEYGQGSTADYYYYLRSGDSEKGSGYNPLGAGSTSGLSSWGPKLDGTEYYQYYNEQLGIGGHLDQYGDFQRDKTPFVSLGDWFQRFFQNGTRYNNSIVISGKINDRNSVRVSFTDTRSRGIVPNSPSSYDFLSIRTNSGLTKWLKMETSINYKHTQNDNIPTSSGYGSTAIMYGLWCYAPNTDMNWARNYWLDKEAVQQDTSLSGGKNNPYFLANECINDQNRNRIYGNVKFDADITKDLTLMVRGGLDNITDFRTQRQGTSTQARPSGWYREQNIYSSQYTADFLLKYNHRWGEFEFTGNVGGSILAKQYRRHSQIANNLKQPGVYSIANSVYDPKVENYSEKRQTNSLYGMLSFSWKDAIFLDVTGRNDWSSTLPAHHRSYFYPSVSGSVALNDLFDFGKTGGLVNLMKIRASWARVGHDTAPYRTEEYLATTGFAGTAAIQGTKVNPNLLPEMVSSWEVGFELRMFRNRLTLDAAYYDAVTDNLISKMPISYATGTGAVYTNAGSIRNNGVEIALNGTLVKVRDFQWKLGVNWTMNRNRVLSLGKGIDSWIVASYSTHAYMTAYEGGSVTDMYGKGYKRAPQGAVAIDAEGKMVDVSGMLLLDKQNMPQVDTELKFLGNVAPDWKGGFNTTLKWKGLSATVSFDGQWGGHVYSYTNWVLNYRGKGVATLEGREGGFVPTGVRETADGNYVFNTDAILKENISSFYECKYDNTNAEANFVETTFLKLREVRLEYSFPKKLLAKTKVISGLTISAFGNNLYCWSKFPGWDPEGVSMRGSAIIPGFDILQMPSAAQFGASVNITF